MTSSNKILISIIAIILCGCVLLALGVYYMFSVSSQSTLQYFLTVSEVIGQESKFIDRNIRISGVVLGDTIEYNEASFTLSFTIADVPADYKEVEDLGGLEKVLRDSANNPNSPIIKILYTGPQPDLLRDEAQAIITGKLGSDGIFYADEILLRCPTRYEEAVPNQVE